MGLMSKKLERHCAYLVNTPLYEALYRQFNWVRIRRALEKFNDV
uniref:Uncharacterized protein n=1 Tax=Nitrosopumivirus cobalaminus TaxID=3158414 RepID=A0AAU7N4A1_9VIRU